VVLYISERISFKYYHKINTHNKATSNMCGVCGLTPDRRGMNAFVKRNNPPGQAAHWFIPASRRARRVAARLWVGGWRRTKAREKATARPRALTGRDLTHDRIEESLLTCTEPEGRVAVGWASGWVGGWVGGWEEKEGGWAGDWACGAGAAALDEPVALVDRLHPRSVHSVRNGLRHLQPARRQPPREPQPVRAERRCDADHGRAQIHAT
jgi:hypothetical protein